MKKPEVVEHEGRVVGIGMDTISVEIVNKSACAACHAKEVCNASDESIRIIEIPYTISSLSEEYSVGEEVMVLLKASLGMTAVFLAYVLPLLLLVAAIIVMPSIGLGELTTGLAAIGVVAVYYVVLFMFRGKLDRIYSFSIKKK